MQARGVGRRHRSQIGRFSVLCFLDWSSSLLSSWSRGFGIAVLMVDRYENVGISFGDKSLLVLVASDQADRMMTPLTPSVHPSIRRDVLLHVMELVLVLYWYWFRTKVDLAYDLY